MKLHSLEIQAFGPFSQKEIINFSALGDNALFLIDGPTGAGKSSILHAICYALYGETTDSERKDFGLRCDHAATDTLTELSLEFSIRGDKYRITRVPTQMRPARRGSGETEQKPTAHLRRVSDSAEEETLVAKKTRDADAEIERIVGLTSQQFLQVMVLPQGKFRELLLAKSDDRQLILSTLFQTEIYKQIEQLLKDKAGAIEKHNQSFEDRKTGAYSDVGITEGDELEILQKEAICILDSKRQEKEKLADQKQHVATKLVTAGALGKIFETRNNKQKELETYLQKTDEINAVKTSIERAEKASSIAPEWLVLQNIVKDIETKQDDIAKAEKDKNNVCLLVCKARDEVKRIEVEYKQRDILKADETTIKGYQEILVSYQLLKERFVKADENYKQAIDQKGELEEQVLYITNDLKKLQFEIEILEKESANKAEVVEQKLSAKGLFDQRKKLESARTELNSFNQAYQLDKEKFELADKDHKKSEKEANQIEMLWFSSQAAVLAAKLELDQPCAVCGSLQHPNPANFSDEALDINQQTIDHARKIQAKHLKVMNRLKELEQGCLHSVSAKENDVNKLEIELAGDANKPVAELEKIYQTLDENLKQIEEKENQLLKTKKLKIEKQNKCEPITHKLKSIEAKTPELTALKATAKSELESANKILPEKYRSHEIIEQSLIQVRQKITGLENKYITINKGLTDSLTKQSSIEAKLNILNNNLVELNIRQESQSLIWQKALIDSEFVTLDDFSNAQLHDESLEVLRHKVKTYDELVKALQVELRLLAKQLKDKQRPDLTALQQQFDQANGAFIAAEGLWTDASQQLQQLNDTQKKVELIESQQVEIKKQYEIVGTLSKAASGRGNVRVSLERFVLGNILDQVLSIASDRLHIMSKGQYRLIRQDEENQKRNTTAGLDLAIDDAYTGKTRPVATLSGGESFMASLALALGLSDVVQERSGGIQLDTLFIDEGFGSLDQDSLQLAINTLIDLQATGRTIGIISHVSELKEQMAQRIEVVGSRMGSSIKMVS